MAAEVADEADGSVSEEHAIDTGMVQCAGPDWVPADPAADREDNPDWREFVVQALSDRVCAWVSSANCRPTIRRNESVQWAEFNAGVIRYGLGSLSQLAVSSGLHIGEIEEMLQFASILAHEVGHWMDDAYGRRPRQRLAAYLDPSLLLGAPDLQAKIRWSGELFADAFATCVLRSMGASGDQLKAATDVLSRVGTATHPPAAARQQAIDYATSRCVLYTNVADVWLR